MFYNIDIEKMSQLTQNNKDADQIIRQLMENHRRIVSEISHEIRNPLTLISSSLQLMQVQRPDVTSDLHWLQIADNVDYICQLLKELSAFNNSDSLHYSVFSMEQLLKEIVISFVISLDEENPDIEFTSSIPNDLGLFTGDKVKLREVFLNLLKNAKEAIDGEGTILLTVQREASSLFIKLTDNGCGIEAEHLESIFEPFITYKQGGTGLGLPICKRIIEAHNGILRVHSAPGKGATFSIVLPVQSFRQMEDKTSVSDDTVKLPQ